MSVVFQYLDFLILKWIKFAFGSFSHTSRPRCPILGIILHRNPKPSGTHYC